MSKPDCPPSPYIVCGQLSLPAVPSQVPLSCVPPCRCFGSRGSTETVLNCSVESPVFRLEICVGTIESAFWHATRLAGLSGRSVQSPEASAVVPLDLTTPPSEPSKKSFGFDGETTRACWSGWMPFCGSCVSAVWSPQCSPASTESRTVLPLLRRPA